MVFPETEHQRSKRKLQLRAKSLCMAIAAMSNVVLALIEAKRRMPQATLAFGRAAPGRRHAGGGPRVNPEK